MTLNKITLIGLLSCFWWISSAQTIVINEFMAANDTFSLIVDEVGQSEDWIELYNNSDQAIDLEGWYLSDKVDSVLKWPIPAGITIGADGYLIFWADEDQPEGLTHTNFKLNKLGEAIILSDPSGALVDMFEFGLQETNVPMARVPNGTGNFIQQAATFNANNGPVAVFNIPDYQELLAYPNPANQQIFIEFDPDVFKDAHFHLYSSFGQELSVPFERFEHGIQLNTSKLAIGFYFVELKAEGNFARTKIQVLR